MSDAALETANTRLASSPEFDPAQSARLGLFVVARLAARHGVRVRLRPPAKGGVTAVVLIPADLVTTEPPAGPDPATLGTASADPSRRLAAGRRRAACPAHPPPSTSSPPPVPDPAAVATPAASGRGAAAAGSAARRRPRPVRAERAGDAGPATPRRADDGLDGLPRRVRRQTPAAQPRSTVSDTPVAPLPGGGPPSDGRPPGRHGTRTRHRDHPGGARRRTARRSRLTPPTRRRPPNSPTATERDA